MSITDIPEPTPLEAALMVIDQLREDIETGRVGYVVCCAVVKTEDNVIGSRIYSAQAQPVPTLAMKGALLEAIFEFQKRHG